MALGYLCGSPLWPFRCPPSPALPVWCVAVLCLWVCVCATLSMCARAYVTYTSVHIYRFSRTRASASRPAPTAATHLTSAQLSSASVNLATRSNDSGEREQEPALRESDSVCPKAVMMRCGYGRLDARSRRRPGPTHRSCSPGTHSDTTSHQRENRPPASGCGAPTSRYS